MKLTLSLALITAGIAVLFTSFVGSGSASEAAEINPVEADAVLTPAQVKSDLALAEEAFERVHPGYTRYATDAEMRRAWAAIISKAEAEGGMPLGDFSLAVYGALTNIRCDHTKAELPRSMRAARKGRSLYLPLRWEWIEGRGIVGDLSAKRSTPSRATSQWMATPNGHGAAGSAKAASSWVGALIILALSFGMCLRSPH